MTANSAVSAIPFQGNCRNERLTQVIGSTWFLLIGFMVAYGVVHNLRSSSWPQVVSQSTLAAFYFVLWFLIATRLPAKSRETRSVARIVAFVGTYLPLSFSFMPPNKHALSDVLSAICVVTGTMLMLLTVTYLGRAFSIVPQARSVAQSGPYRWIRHPLYLAEQIAILGAMLQCLSFVSISIFVVHVGLQISRMLFEESLLRRNLPEYNEFAATRWRFIPFIW